MKADKTREILEISYVCEEGIAICESKYYQCKAELEELERLAEIGKATERAYYKGAILIYDIVENNIGSIIRYNRDETVEDILAWTESEAK